MNRKVILINPRKGWRPPLGLLYVASYLRKAGFEVKVIEFIDDDFFSNRNEKLWEDFYEFDADFIGFGVITWNRMVTLDYVSKIRKTTKNKYIIVGGKDPAFYPKKYLDKSVDCAVIGEGEETTIELFDAISSGKPIDNIPGLAYLKNDEIYYTKPREPFNISENLLYPSLDLVDYNQYADIRLGGIPGHFIKTGFIMANRGCPFQCKFCTENVRNVYRERSVDDIIEEIKWQIDKYKIKGMVFLDDLFYFTERRVQNICNRILEEKLNIKFYAQARVDRVGSEETLRLMKKAGFIQLALGVESGSPKMLELMNKGTNVEQIKVAIKKINEAGIFTYSFLIIGLPGEKREDLEMTINLLKELNTTFVAVNFYTPMPGTPYFEEEDNEMLEKISYSLTESPSFRSTLSPEEILQYRSKYFSLAAKSADLNLLRYPSFYFFLIKTVLFHPGVLLKGILLQKKEKKYPSYYDALRTAMINFRIYN